MKVCHRIIRVLILVQEQINDFILNQNCIELHNERDSKSFDPLWDSIQEMNQRGENLAFCIFN